MSPVTLVGLAIPLSMQGVELSLWKSWKGHISLREQGQESGPVVVSICTPGSDVSGSTFIFLFKLNYLKNFYFQFVLRRLCLCTM